MKSYKILILNSNGKENVCFDEKDERPAYSFTPYRCKTHYVGNKVKILKYVSRGSPLRLIEVDVYGDLYKGKSKFSAFFLQMVIASYWDQ
jgi:hypothetical protein